MSDLYIELLVKKKKTSTDTLLKVLMIGATVIFVLGGILFNPIILLLAVVMGVVDYFKLPSLDLEYEYLYVNGELDIDKIMSKSKRKRVKTLNISECDLMAPVNSHRMDYYNSNQKMKVLDYSSGNPQHKRFAIITRDSSGTCQLIIEPDETLAKTMRNTAPSKVFLD